MVFSKLLDTLTSAFESPTRKNIRQRNVRPINELQQGMNLLHQRKQILNSLSNSSLLESMSSSMKTFQSGKDKLNSVSKAELDLLKNMENDFNKSLSSYSQKYKSFMENYYNAVQEVEKCKADCLTKYPPGSTAESFNKEACKGGCDLKGPYVSKCEDTFTKSRIASLGDCASATKGKCMDGNVVLTQDNFVDDIGNADSNNVTLRKGCCDCGGGGGGPPTTSIRGKNIKNCNEMPAAFGYNGSSGNYIKNSCLTAPVASQESNAGLYKEYELLTSENKSLISQAEKIFQKIKKLNSLNSNLDVKMKSTRQELQDNLDDYSTIYSKLQSSKRYGITTLNGQVEDIDLKEKNQMLQLGIWGSLAVLLLLVTVDKLRK